MRRLIFLLAMLFVISAHDAVAEIAGRASVIAGDTIEMRGERIRLYGKIISCSGGGVCPGSRQEIL